MISSYVKGFLTVVLILGGLLGSTSSAAQSLSHKLSAYMEYKATLDHFNGSVIVVKDSEILLARGYGWANMEHHVPNTPKTKFRIGSITKQFTAMAILILQEQGKLNVGDLINTHIPNPPPVWSQITIHHLLTHTSGIKHSWGIPDWKDTVMLPATLAETIDKIKGQPLLFTPGTNFNYSGAGYFILAQIIEQVSGQSYATFLRQVIFEPLGMNDTGADQTIPILPHQASGYTREGAQVFHGPYIYMPNLTGGGNLYSTVEDLARWDQALVASKLISDSSYTKMYTPDRNNYAYGWRVKERGGRTEIQHGGSLAGFKTFILRLPEERVCVVVLSNVAEKPKDPRLSVKRMAQELVDIVFE